MIYAIGRIEEYEPKIDAGLGIKLGPGRRSDGTYYPGGWVWRTAEEAAAYIKARNAPEPRRVYGVIADWDKDTREVLYEPTRCLNRDAAIVRVPQPE
jgi:hypothetical protein